MKQISKITLLNNLEERVEAQLKEIIEVYQNLAPEVLLKPASNGGWSIAQCLQHLNTYGHHYLPLIKNGLENQPMDAASNSFKSTWLGDYFTGLIEPKAGMKKMKTFKNHIPEMELDAHKVVAECIQQLETLLHCLKLAERKDLNTIRISVSIAKFIRLKLGDVFQFIIAHNERHLVQAGRNL